MTVNLRDQLRELCAVIDEEQGPIAVHDIQASDSAVMLLDQPARSIPSKRRGWLIAVAAAAFVVLAVLAPLLLFAGDTEPDVGGTEPDVATSVPLTTALQATTPPQAAGWSRIPHDEAVFGGGGEQSMHGVTVGGPGLVAVGATDGWQGDGDAAVWTSPDGITWTRVPHDETVFGGATMWDVTVGGPGLVAVGWDGDILDDSPDVDAAIWTSVDGVTWSRVLHDDEVFGAAFITSVTVGGPGLVAVGGTDGFFTDGDAALWTSVNGITWSRVAHDETVFGGANSQVINDVTVGGPGLVAVGNDGGIGPWDNNADTNAAVWTSVDGITWWRVPHDETVFGTGGNPSMLGVTVGGPGLVAVGADYFPSTLAETPVWTSVDGITWTRVPNDVTVRGSMTGVTAGGSGLVAVGAEARVWTSVDGITWSRVQTDDAVFGADWISRVTVGGPGLVAVGRDGRNAAVWNWRVED